MNDLNLDHDEARALHRIVRAMHDGDAITRAAAALGYEWAYTYTLQSESGASLKASGFEIDAELEARPSWDCPARRRTQTDMFGNERRPPEAKIRWKKRLGIAAAKGAAT